jgi:3-oxoacyl-[acyl-carrier-protein] synthase-1
MVSSVGRDVVTACAATRAGVRRPSEVAGVPLLDDEGGTTPMAGYPIRGFTDGFFLTGRWIRMAQACLVDLVRYGALPAAEDSGFWSRTGLMLATPWLDEDRFQEPESDGLADFGRDYAAPLLRLAGVPVATEHVGVVSLGHGAAAVAVLRAADALGEGALDRVIVLAADTYVDPYTLEWLAQHGRLKTPEAPAGLIPGEASAAFLLETETAARRRGARVEAVLEAAAAGTEANHFFTDEVNAGLGLSDVIAQLLPADAVFDGDLFTDLNGENWRAYELGCAQARLGGRLAGDVRVVLPCDSLGETGAASAVIAVCMAVRSFVRGYGTKGRALVVSSSEHGHLGGLLLAQA